MGVRILRDHEAACMYCSTTDWAFGPVFSDSDTHDADERLELFLKWLPEDARTYSEPELESKYSNFLALEEELWKSKEEELEKESE